MDTLQCAIVLAKLTRFDWEVDQRVALGARYNELLDQRGVPRVIQRPDRTSVFAQYTVFTEDRDGLQDRLSAKGVPTAVHYPSPMNKQLPYRDYCCVDCTPVADSASKRVMSLPLSPDLEFDAVKSIVDMISSGRC